MLSWVGLPDSISQKPISFFVKKHITDGWQKRMHIKLVSGVNRIECEWKFEQHNRISLALVNKPQNISSNGRAVSVECNFL